MLWKKIASLALIGAISMGCLAIPASAVEEASPAEQPNLLRAYGRFDVTVPASSVKQTGDKLNLMTGDVVSIDAAYSPSDANVDFGVLDSEGIFYYVRTGDGSIGTEIEITERGTYTFAIRNNSSQSISVSGYVNY